MLINNAQLSVNLKVNTINYAGKTQLYMLKKEFCPQKQISISPGTVSAMVMHYGLRTFISKSTVSGFNPNTNKKNHSKQKFRFSLAVDDIAANTDFFISAAGDAGGNRFLNISWPRTDASL